MGPRGGAPISYDPNLRAPLWPSLAEAHRRLREPLDRTHILKASIEELAFLVAPAPDGAILARPLEPSDGEAASAQLMEAYPNLVAVVVTFGGRGAAVRTRWGWSFVPPFRVPVRDTTGAGMGWWPACSTGSGGWPGGKVARPGRWQPPWTGIGGTARSASVRG